MSRPRNKRKFNKQNPPKRADNAQNDFFSEVSTVNSYLYFTRPYPFNPDEVVGKKGLKKYTEMYRDEQVKAAMLAKQFAVIAPGWDIEPAQYEGDAENKTAQEIADFVEQNFTDIEGSFDTKLLEMLSAFVYGFCLHGDTLIHTPSGDKPIRELVGTQPWVFSRVNGKLKLAKASRVWLTKREAQCVKVRYEWRAHGEQKEEFVICTPEHPFQMLDGEYIKASELVAGARLAPFSQKFGMPGKAPYKRRRAYLKVGKSWNDWQKRSHWVWEQITENKLVPKHHVHHKDEDTLNDDPDNLEMLKGARHTGYHSDKWWHAASENAKRARNEKIRIFNSSSLSRKIRRVMASSANILAWQNPEIRKRRIAGMKGKKRSGEALANIRASTQNLERNRKISEARKLYWKNRRELGADDSSNHRIVAVEPFGLADVYDMEVPGTSNFAANRVFVHNSVAEKIFFHMNVGQFAGKVGLKDLKFRNPEGFDFRTDPFGNLLPDGVLQATRPLPAEKFMIYSYRKRFSNLYGDSDLRECYRPVWAKDNTIKFMMITLERYGEPTWVFTTKGLIKAGNQISLQNFMQDIQSKSGLILPDTITAEPKYPAPQAARNYLPILEYLDGLIRAALGMPSLIGPSSTEQKGGSYARAQTQYDLFLNLMRFLRNDVEANINEQVIKQLVDFNYEITDGKYPAFKFKEISEEEKQQLYDNYLKGLQAKGMTKTREDELFFRDHLGIPTLPEDYPVAGEVTPEIQAQQDAQKQAILDAQAEAIKNPQPKNPNEPTNGSKQVSPNGKPPATDKQPVPPAKLSDEQKIETESDRHAREYADYRNKQQLQNYLINNDRNRDLTSDEARHVQTMMPKAVSMQYLDVPGVDRMHKDMDIDPNLDTDVKKYHQAKARLFNKQPKRRLALDSLTLTQTHIHKGRVEDMSHDAETLNDPVQVLKYGQSHYLMDGHHRVVARHVAGKKYAMANVYNPPITTYGDKEYFNPNHVPSGAHGGEFAPGGDSSEELSKAADRATEAAGMTKKFNSLREAIKSGTQTKNDFIDSSGNYTTERQTLHDKIVQSFLSGTQSVENPSFIMTGGLPGSGKTNITRSMDLSNYVKVDADAVRAKLPEYKGWNASLTQAETDDIVVSLISKAVSSRKNVIFDATMKNYAKHESLLSAFKGHGYSTNVIFVDLPPQKAMERAIERFTNAPTGTQARFVDPHYIASQDSLNKASYEKLKSKADSYSLYNNDVARGEKAKLVEKS